LNQKAKETILGKKEELPEAGSPTYLDSPLTRSVTEQKYEEAQRKMHEKYRDAEVLPSEGLKPVLARKVVTEPSSRREISSDEGSTSPVVKRKNARSPLPVTIEKADPVPLLYKEARTFENLGDEAKNSKSFFSNTSHKITNLYTKAKEKLGIMTVTPRQIPSKDEPIHETRVTESGWNKRDSPRNWGFWSPERKTEKDRDRQVSPTPGEKDKKVRERVEQLKNEKFDEKPTMEWSEYFAGGGFE